MRKQLMKVNGDIFREKINQISEAVDYVDKKNEEWLRLIRSPDNPDVKADDAEYDSMLKDENDGLVWVLDRAKEALASLEALYQEVLRALAKTPGSQHPSLISKQSKVFAPNQQGTDRSFSPGRISNVSHSPDQVQRFMHAVVAASTVSQNSGSSNRRTPQAQITVLMCKIIWVANPQDPDKKIEAAVFFDSGCQRSFITEELAEQLISAVRRPIFIATFAEMQSKVYDSREVRVNLVLKSVQNAITACTMQFLAQKLLIAQISDREGQQLKQANLNVIQSAIVCKKPQIVVDLEYYFSFIKGRHTVLNPEFQLIDSAVGWMIAGEGAVNNITMKTKKVLAQTAIIVNTVLDEQPDLENGITEKVEDAVIIPLRNTTKLRVVFDASAKTPHEKSLNDELLKGPTILPESCGILLRFRQARIILLTDVEKAFHQIDLH
ncbi:unnamed protein product [Gongylonema pulchrum]|uniref:DUF1758 domain-containing protein n=1 Tax=Gongylonema pulchrum TaxID=637853 RepID=A0A183EMS3_9BILA|nr:unnamed protein product [Gongylonema pulchrum]